MFLLNGRCTGWTEYFPINYGFFKISNLENTFSIFSYPVLFKTLSLNRAGTVVARKIESSGEEEDSEEAVKKKKKRCETEDKGCFEV